MKILKSKMVISIILLSVLAILPQVYAKTSIEIKPNASTVYTNKTISQFFDESMAMKNVGEGLEGDNVDVHMAKNTEWAIVSYFSNSAYGTNGEGKNAGVTMSINGKNYLSTNGNATGVMNFGKTSTFTAGLISNYADISDTSIEYKSGKSIIENSSNNKHVDLMNWSSWNNMAITSWYDAIGMKGTSTNYPYSLRVGLFGFVGGYSSGNLTHANGTARTEMTFRPVIYN